MVSEELLRLRLGEAVSDVRAYVEAAQARSRGEAYAPALATALGLSVDQVGAYRDVAAYIAAVESSETSKEEIWARHAVIRFHRGGVEHGGVACYRADAQAAAGSAAPRAAGRCRAGAVHAAGDR